MINKKRWLILAVILFLISGGIILVNLRAGSETARAQSSSHEEHGHNEHEE